MIDPKRVRDASWSERAQVAWLYALVMAGCLLFWGLVISLVVALWW